MFGPYAGVMYYTGCGVVFFFSSRRRHTRFKCDWSSDVCSSDLVTAAYAKVDIQVPQCEVRHLTQARDIDLGIGGRDLGSAMSEMVPNFLERQALRQQASSAGVPKGVRAMLSKRKSQRPESFGNNGPGGAASQRLDGRLHRKKDLAIFRRAWTPGLQVTEDGLPHRFDQRITLYPAPL